MNMTATKNSTPSIEMETVDTQAEFGLDTPFEGDNLKTFLRPKSALPFVPKKKDFYFNKEDLRDLFITRELNLPTMLVGPKGCGKTEQLEQFYARLGMPFVRVQGGPGIDADYLFGRIDLEEGKTTFLHGVATMCWKNGFALCIDEIDGLRSNLGPELNALFEMGPTFTLTGLGHKKGIRPDDLVIPRNHNHRLYATSNTGGKAEKDSAYAGTNPINGATRDRMVYLERSYMPQDEEIKILKKHCQGVSETGLKIMTDIAGDMRTAYLAGEAFEPISTRSLIQWGKLWSAYGEADKPFIMAIYSNLNSHDRGLVESFFETKFRTLVLPAHLKTSVATI